jgi:signal transduction histidine kinase
MVQLQLGMQKNINPECLIEPEFHKSLVFNTEVEDAMRLVSLIAFQHKELENVPFYYYFNSGSKDYSNIGKSDRAFYEQYDRSFFYMEEGVWKDRENTSRKTDFGYEIFRHKTVAYIAFTDYYLDINQRQWDRNRELLLPNAIILLASVLIGFVLIILSCIVTGRELQDDKIHLMNLDKSYTEVLLLALGLGVGLFVSGISDILGEGISLGLKMDLFGMDFLKIFSTDNGSLTIFIAVVSALAGVVFLMLVHSLIRKWRVKIFIRDSILYRISYKLCKLIAGASRYLCYGDLFHQASYARNLYYRQMCFLVLTITNTTIAVYLVTKLVWWAILPFVIEVLVFVWYTIGNRHVYDMIDQEIKKRTEEQMKSERMKIELITNVSHDLKTPLTSIISFVDLLSKEEPLTEAARDYIRIIQEKSERLSDILTDLFDLAKSTSGDMALNLENIDLGKLIRQTLAELDDRITDSEITFKIKFPELPVHINADGNKLYRVFQNIIDNALKYTLGGTRVYIDMSLTEERVIVSMKNIASYDMNFTSQEILQRFARGDQARTSEGNGLGLSIAESYTKLCGGDFQIEMEGDMFKVYLSFEQASDPVVMKETIRNDAIAAIEVMAE